MSCWSLSRFSWWATSIPSTQVKLQSLWQVLIKSAIFFPDFQCMNALHTTVSSLFLVPNLGMLQPLPLKLNFVPKFALSYVVEWTIRLMSSILQFLLQLILDIDDIPCPEFLLNLPLSNSEQQSLEFRSTLPSLGNSLDYPWFHTFYGL
jgi:hypothetical protein